MLSPRPLASSALALVGLAVTLGFSRSAHATQSLTIATAQQIGTDLLVDELVVEGTGVLQVTPLRGGGAGIIHIRARKITVKSGGVISANAAGNLGVNAADGGAAIASGGGKHSTTNGHPGGGGGYAGAGASGANEACTALADAAGGEGFALPSESTPILGSAGGAAHSTSAASAGGDGGGAILLEAAEIQIDGSVEARGDSPKAVSGVAPGAGSGGFIAITTAHLTGTGTISVAGGAGPAALGVLGTIPANHGGGGSGGSISIHARDVAPEIASQLDIKGGATGSCSGLAGADGVATIVDDDPTFCVDVDADGHRSSSCGGDDCDDTDAAINPDAKEKCNAVDDNCDGSNNEGEGLCPAGRTCDATALMCLDVSAPGADAGPGTSAGAPPDHLVFEGGCAIGGSAGGFGLLATAALGASALLRRRRPTTPTDKAAR